MIAGWSWTTGVGAVPGTVAFLAACISIPAAWLSIRRRGKDDAADAEAPGTVLDRVRTSRVLRVGYIAAVPWFIDGGSGPPEGIYPLLFDDIAAREGLHVVYRRIRNHELLERLEADDVDLVAQLLQTKGRARRADFSACIHRVAVIAVARRGQTEINARDDLKKRSIRAVTAFGEIGHEVAREFYGMSEENGRLVSVNTDDVPEIFHLVRGRTDLAISTGAHWLEFQRTHPEVAAGLEPIRFGTNADGALLRLPAGTMIKHGEDAFGEWLERETATSREKAQIREREAALVASFSDEVDAM